MSADARPRVLLLFPAHSYRVDAFVAAAERVGVELVLATDLPEAFGRYGLSAHKIDFAAPGPSADELGRALSGRPPVGVVATNEPSAVLAALLAERFGIPHVSGDAARAAQNKRLMRVRLARAGVPSPAFRVVEPDADPADLAAFIAYPCVVKPPMLSGSQGVIRADDPDAFIRAVHRIRGILARHPVAHADPDFFRLLVEDYIDGGEVAVEALVTRGELEPFAVFDKPDDLSGPYFEETLYVTPSRLDESTQRAIVEVTAAAARALGLSHGPIHAELRVAASGPVVVEIAARSIGGLCSRVFELAAGPLEDVLLAHACGLRPQRRALESAAGVLMIPIPRSGVLRRVSGLDAARAVPGIDSVTIALRTGEAIRTLPEGNQYLGFVFAHGASAEAVERALRKAHAELGFDLAPLLDLAPNY